MQFLSNLLITYARRKFIEAKKKERSDSGPKSKTAMKL